MAMYKKLSIDTINRNILKAEYAVRGAVPLRAMQIQRELAQGTTFGFQDVVSCNIGNPQALKQRPISFFRQVAVLCLCPELIGNDTLGFPIDAHDRARAFLNANPNGMGAYTHSQGYVSVRREIAAFIENRDGFPSDPDLIFLTDGASPAVKACLNILSSAPEDGVMIPRPQYPLYSATLAMNGTHAVSYSLCEEEGWTIRVPDLQAALEDAASQGIKTRGIAVINPGNPTGAVLTRDAIADICRFAYQHDLVILADEVYQENVYVDTRSFISFKAIVRELEAAGECVGLQLASFHSVSKGFLGECGLRGGFMELANFTPEIIDQFYKMVSVNLCPNTLGQLVVGLMTNPPRPDSPSGKVYADERDAILRSLKERAGRSAAMFNALPGCSCQTVEGALYAFPQITMPEGAVTAATEAGQAADLFYCLAMLDSIGVCVVPGSGFGQEPGTWHFRTTILPAGEAFERYLREVPRFHTAFIDKYSVKE